MASASLVTRPMPLAPPVTMAVFPRRSALVASRTSKAVEQGPREAREGGEGEEVIVIVLLAKEREREGEGRGEKKEQKKLVKEEEERVLF